jgi:hypothetical protein
MALTAVVAHSQDPDSEGAVLEILEQCQQRLNGQQPQIGILYAAIDFEFELILDRICMAFPDIQLIGGTTDAEISSELGFQQDSLALLLLSADDVEMQIGVGRDLSQDIVAATEAAVQQAQTKLHQPAQLCMTLADTIGIDSNVIVMGLQAALGKNFPILGGMTGDRLKFEKTWQFCNREILSNSVIVLLFAGNIQFSHSISHGWIPLTEPAEITAAHGTTLQTINGKPALEFYQHYLNGAEPSLEYPFAIQIPDTEQFYLRCPFPGDPIKGDITAFAGFPASGKIQIAHANRDAVIGAAGESFQQALDHYPATQPAVALVFSCCTRRLIMGTQTDKEYQTICHFDPKLPIFGFYSYGEIAPPLPNQPAQLHHETMATLLIGSH